MMRRTVACMLHRQPVSACCGCAMTSSSTPSGPVTECDALISSSEIVSIGPASVLRSRVGGRTGMWLICSAGMPSVSARFGLESPSMASTRWPLRASSRAIVPEIEVFPDPPLPAIASFMEGTIQPLLYGFNT